MSHWFTARQIVGLPRKILSTSTGSISLGLQVPVGRCLSYDLLPDSFKKRCEKLNLGSSECKGDTSEPQPHQVSSIKDILGWSGWCLFPKGKVEGLHKGKVVNFPNIIRQLLRCYLFITTSTAVQRYSVSTYTGIYRCRLWFTLKLCI